MQHSVFLRVVFIWASALFGSLNAYAQSSTEDFSEYYDQVYQIRVVSPQAGSKSSIGSGFQVSADGLIITNYHVVSTYVQSPQTHSIEYRSHTGELGHLELLDFDVVHDLALLRHSKPGTEHFEFADSAMNRGDNVYALGNPRDYGVTLVRGPNNGLVEHSYNEQVLFSGSLNPGMSGGPALNKMGQVVGVNVATAGSQLSFLVPASKAIKLANAARSITQDLYQSEITAQIKQWQRPRIQQLIDSDWPVELFSEHELFGEIRKDFQCWGSANSDDEERHIDAASKSCRAGNSIYLDNDLDAGQLSFSFTKDTSIDLTVTQFSQTMKPSMRADNDSNYENSTNYRCHVDFLEGESSDYYQRVTTCIRSYKKLDGLFDSLLLVERNGNSEAFASHLSLSAVERDQIQAMNRKFIEKSL